jgi:hypothetical protein
MEKVKTKNTQLRKENIFFSVVGLDKGGRDFFHFKEEDQFNIKLVSEPKNRYDKNAVMVYVGELFVGYVAANECLNIKAFLKREKDKGHVMSYCLLNKYSASVRFLLTDLTLSLKRRKNNKFV